MYCPDELMVPRPLLESPPAEVVHVTAAGPPPVEVAVNSRTAPPAEFFELHPTQFVSMPAVPGEMEKAELEALLIELPPPQPASAKSKGNIAPDNSRKAAKRRPRVRDFAAAPRCAGLRLVSVLSAINSPVPLK